MEKTEQLNKTSSFLSCELEMKQQHIMEIISYKNSSGKHAYAVDLGMRSKYNMQVFFNFGRLLPISLNSRFLASLKFAEF